MADPTSTPLLTKEEQAVYDSLPADQKALLSSGSPGLLEQPLPGDRMEPVEPGVDSFLRDNISNTAADIYHATPEVLKEVALGGISEAGGRAGMQGASKLASAIPVGPGRASRAIAAALQGLGIIGGGAAGGVAGDAIFSSVGQGEPSDPLSRGAQGGIEALMGIGLADIVAPRGADIRKGIDSFLRSADRKALREVDPKSRRGKQIVEAFDDADVGFARAMQPSLGDMDATRGLPAIDAVKELQELGELANVSNLREFTQQLERKIGSFKTRPRKGLDIRETFKEEGELGGSIGRHVDALAALEDAPLPFRAVDSIFSSIEQHAIKDGGLTAKEASRVVNELRESTLSKLSETPQMKQLAEKAGKLRRRQSQIESELAKISKLKTGGRGVRARKLKDEFSKLGAELTEVNKKLRQPPISFKQMFDEKRKFQTIGGSRKDGTPAEDPTGYIAQLIGSELRDLVERRAINLDSAKGEVGDLAKRFFLDSRKFELYRTAQKAINKAGNQALKRPDDAIGGPNLMIRGGQAGGLHVTTSERLAQWILGSGDPQEAAFKQMQMRHHLRDGGIPESLDIGLTDTGFIKHQIGALPRRIGANVLGKGPSFAADVSGVKGVRNYLASEVGKLPSDILTPVNEIEPQPPTIVSFADTPSGRDALRRALFTGTQNIAEVDLILSDFEGLPPEKRGVYLSGLFEDQPQAAEALTRPRDFKELIESPDLASDILISFSGDPATVEAFQGALESGREHEAIRTIALAAGAYPAIRRLLPEPKKTGLMSEYSYKGNTFLASPQDVETYKEVILESDGTTVSKAAAVSALHQRYPKVIPLGEKKTKTVSGGR